MCFSKYHCVVRPLWHIPLTYKTSASDTVEHFLLKKKTGQFFSWRRLIFIYLYPLSTYCTYSFNSIRSLCLSLPLSLSLAVLCLPEKVDWVKFNVDMSGYYMVHYAGEGWNSITKLLQYNHTALSSNDRASLIHNVFQLVRSV